MQKFMHASARLVKLFEDLRSGGGGGGGGGAVNCQLSTVHCQLSTVHCLTILTTSSNCCPITQDVEPKSISAYRVSKIQFVGSPRANNARYAKELSSGLIQQPE